MIAAPVDVGFWRVMTCLISIDEAGDLQHSCCKMRWWAGESWILGDGRTELQCVVLDPLTESLVGDSIHLPMGCD